jgi:plastocyanin
MISSVAKILLASGLVMQASAATIKIEVGKGGMVFSPTEAKAAVGDVLEFHFLTGNHSVVQGDFDNACHPSTTGGFFSGYLPAPNGENVSFSSSLASAVLETHVD